jgi:hypothetical protein
VDLIAGLPGEDIDSFAAGFDKLWALGPHEIQFGILKRLRGTPIIRHTGPFAMAFDPYPPYTILATDRISFTDMQRLVRFSRYWDLVANSGRFANTIHTLLGESPFANFMRFADWLYANTDATHRIALERLVKLVEQWLREGLGIGTAEARALLASDSAPKTAPVNTATVRQVRHLAA